MRTQNIIRPAVNYSTKMRIILSPKVVTDLIMSPHIYVVETLRYPEDSEMLDSPEPPEPLRSVVYHSTLISANRAARLEA